MSTATLPARSDVPEHDTWNLTSLYPDDAAFEAAVDATDAAVAALAARRGALTPSAATLETTLADLSSLTAAMSRVHAYASLPTTTDEGDEDARRRYGRTAARLARWRAALAFVRPELLALAPETRRAFEAERPALRRYAPYLDRLEADRAFTRGDEVEDALAEFGGPLGHFARARNTLVGNDVRFAPVSSDGAVREVAPSTIRGLESDPDREVRRQAWSHYADGFLGVRDTLAELYLGMVQTTCADARVRGYASGEARALARHRVEASVLDATLEAFTRRLPVWHRYWEARRRLVGVERLEPWDVFAPLGDSVPHVPYERAAAWIVDSSAPLGEAYQAHLRRGLLEERWVDKPANAGKRDGAFCSHTPGAPHPFVFVSYTDDMSAASVLAHEFGHAMHAVLSDVEQDPLDSVGALSMTVAETASNGQQALMRAHLFAGAAASDPDLELAVLDEALLNFHRYFFVMPTLVRFERAVHDRVWRGDVPTGRELTTLMRDLFQEGYGDAIEADERVGIAWAQFVHLTVPFYTFQYAVGIAASSALTARIVAGEAGAAEAYLDFLRAGASVKPTELFAHTGLEVTTPAPVDAAFDVVEGFVARLEAIAAAKG
ncbi:MAG: oligoendopeptidase F [Trueperaceae bacterium]|nr:MAG: oligoendopeptidase F [Trueperaceae bacterium]